MPSDLAALVERVQSLADERAEEASGDDLLERMEHTLTDGYAHALALEAESMRLEREIGDSVTRLRHGNAEPAHLKDLADRLAATEESIRELRGVLALLRRRVDKIRGHEPLIGG